MPTVKSLFFKDFKNQKNYKNFKPAGLAQVFRIKHQARPFGTPVANSCEECHFEHPGKPGNDK